MRGNIVSRHAQRLIVQFMAACCGKSKTGDKQEEREANEQHGQIHLDPISLPLSRAHAILDRMSSQEMPKAKADDVEEGRHKDETAKLLQQSSQIKSAVQVTASLWNRGLTQWPETSLDRSGDRGKEQGGEASASRLTGKQDKPKKKTSPRDLLM